MMKREATMTDMELQVLRMLHSMALMTQCHLDMAAHFHLVDSHLTFHARQKGATRTE